MSNGWFLQGLILLLVGLAIKAFALPLVQGIIKSWVYLLTLGLPMETRTLRRDMVNSDVWEQSSEANQSWPEVTALHLSARLILGMPQDIVWRIEASGLEPRNVLFWGLYYLTYPAFVCVLYTMVLPDAEFGALVAFATMVLVDVVRIGVALRRQDQVKLYIPLRDCRGSLALLSSIAVFVLLPSPEQVIVSAGWAFLVGSTGAVLMAPLRQAWMARER